MNISISIVAAICSITLAATADTRTLRVNAVDMPCRIDFGAFCPYPSADGGTAQYALQSCPISFNDPLPRGSIVTRIDLRVAFFNSGAQALGSDLGTTYFALNLDFFTSTDRFIGSALPPPDPRPSCLSNPSGFAWRTITGPTPPGGVTWYRSGLQNNIFYWGIATGGDPTVVGGTPSPTAWIEAAEITLHYQPPPIVDFDINSGTPADDRKILIHRWREEPDYRYPSRFQRDLPGTTNTDRDRKIEIGGKLHDPSGAAIANRAVYLRVVDPPDDASPYVVKKGHNKPGDNGAFLGGTLSEVRVVSGNDGRFSTVLTGSEIAGDNYQIQASTVPDFVFTSSCLASDGCYQSGVITNWKRVYVEYDRMFRVGSMVSSPAAAGQNRVEVSPYRREFRRNRRIRLIHAPQVGQPLSNFVTEEAVIDDTIRNRGAGTVTLILSGNLQDSYAPSTAAGGELADGVGLITGNDDDDLYNLRDANNDFSPSLFASAFVDYQFLLDRDNPVPFVPYVETVNHPALLAEHWCVNHRASPAGAITAEPNHQHLLAGSQALDMAHQGVTEVNGGTNYSWLWIDRIEGAGGANAAQWRKIGEHTAHELGHQWHTNQDKKPLFGSEHCDPLKQYTNDQLFCTMHSTANTQEFWDGRVEFHYIGPAGDVDSEYLFIRRRSEPVPQNP